MEYIWENFQIIVKQSCKRNIREFGMIMYTVSFEIKHASFETHKWSKE
jgi:hypothetical protein